MKEHVVIITGASSGIGKALAAAFGREGYRLVIAARNTASLEEVRRELAAQGYPVAAVPCDVTREEDCRNLVQQAVAAFGTVHVLVNNAGISMRALFNETDLQVIRSILDTNFWGAVLCTKFALPHILENKGSVVGISSIAGKKGLPGRTGYSASKFALEGFLEALRTENLKKGLHVLVACPGFTRSNIRNTALSKDGSVQGESPRDEQKMMQPEEVAERIVRAVRSRRRDLVLTTNGRLTVWLNKFFPGWMDAVVFRHMSKEPGSPFV
jgi:dehydrogenase/reductase SDR family protein 7B